MIRGIHHTAISTGNMEKALKFYRDVLGFEEVFKTGWESGTELFDKIVGLKDSAAKVVMLRAGNTHIELFEYSSPEPKPGDPNRPVCDHGYTHICFDVVDIDSEYERLKKAGMTFNAPPPPDLGVGIRAIYGRDPEGNVIELQEILDAKNKINL
ncbi:MAG: VOC family protein [Desulfobacteraceae bacterium]|jgi:catechol 2,3-dioxygenase-like lactoylglutathione lyase family enzyme|nr:VOC family protein [Desulfobacteraceae bacterium]